jgi:TPR repeat protein
MSLCIALLTSASLVQAQETQAEATIEERIAALEESANAGDVAATKDLAKLYLKGPHPYRDWEKPFALLLPLAEAGDVEAMDMVGSLYRDGKGVNSNNQAAIEWFTKAADAGLASAQYNLGMVYYRWRLNGKYHYGKSRDLLAAAAEQDHALAQWQLGEMYFYGTKIGKDMAQSIAWTKRSAESGLLKAQVTLGDRLLAQQNYEEAVKWLRMAAERDDGHAQFTLGGLYERGRGVDKDEAKALELYTRAGINRKTEGLLAAYELHRSNGDMEQALTFLTLAAGRHNRQAMDEYYYLWRGTSKKMRKKVLQRVRDMITAHPVLKTERIEEWLAAG